MIARPSARIRWKKIIGIVILGYFGFWMVDSAAHLWTLWQDEQVLKQKTATVIQQNRVLQHEIQQMHNPAQLKKMITGQVPFPNTATP